MRVTGISNNVSASGISSGNVGMQTDSYTKNIQKQIADAQQRLQNLSSNQDLSLEEKMKKRQEIQQEIANLNQQLRQHQIEQRKEQQNNQASSAAAFHVVLSVASFLPAAGLPAFHRHAPIQRDLCSASYACASAAHALKQQVPATQDLQVPPARCLARVPVPPAAILRQACPQAAPDSTQWRGCCRCVFPLHASIP